jgi:hypothetical protein
MCVFSRTRQASLRLPIQLFQDLPLLSRSPVNLHVRLEPGIATCDAMLVANAAIETEIREPLLAHGCRSMQQTYD